MQSTQVRIVAHKFVLPSGDSFTVEAPCAQTSRKRAEGYVKQQVAKWEDAQHHAIYFLDPTPIQARMEERRIGVHRWYVGDSGGSRLVKAFTGTTGGTRVLMTKGSQKSFMDAK